MVTTNLSAITYNEPYKIYINRLLNTFLICILAYNELIYRQTMSPPMKRRQYTFAEKKKMLDMYKKGFIHLHLSII
jgi:hypothetical protein